MNNTDVFEPATADITLAEVLAALSDPGRLRVILLVGDTETRCSTYADQLGLHKSTISHHLKVLREAGVTHTRVEGRTRWVRLRRADLDARFPGLLDAVLTAAAADPTLAAAAPVPAGH